MELTQYDVTICFVLKFILCCIVRLYRRLDINYINVLYTIAARPLVSVASGSVFQLLVMTSICPEAIRTYDVGASSSAITITLPGTLPADAQRRK